MPHTGPGASFSATHLQSCTEALETALSSVPAYRAWRSRDPGSSAAIDVRYAAMPLLSKKDLREHTWRGFVPAGRDAEAALQKGEIELVNTSGSTDERVTNVWSQAWWDAAERESWKLNAYTAQLNLGGHQEAILTSPMNTGILSEDGLLPMEKRKLGRFLYLNERASPALWTPELLDRMVSEINIFRPQVIEANPSYLARFARYAAEKSLPVFQPSMAILTYENPTSLHRRQISRVFVAPMASSYGSTEAGYVLMECEAGRLHQNTACCRIDFEPLKPEHGGPAVGRVLLTTLTNPWRSLVRFDVGDLVRLENGLCPCGRTDGFTVSAIEGRTANLTFTTRGTAVTTRLVGIALSAIPRLLEYQLRQTSNRSYSLQVMVEKGAGSKKVPALATEAIKTLYGADSEVTVTTESDLPAEVSGKYRMTRTTFPFDAEPLFAGP